MANRGRFRPFSQLCRNILENPYDEARHERTFCTICHPSLEYAPLDTLTLYNKKLSFAQLRDLLRKLVHEHGIYYYIKNPARQRMRDKQPLYRDKQHLSQHNSYNKHSILLININIALILFRNCFHLLHTVSMPRLFLGSCQFRIIF